MIQYPPNSRWKFETFRKALESFETSNNKIMRVDCSSDSDIMMENIRSWTGSDKYHVTLDFTKRQVIVRKRTACVNRDTFMSQFDITDPEEYLSLLKRYEDLLEEAKTEFSKEWTYCAGDTCRKYVKVKQARTEVLEDKKRVLTRCPECYTIWYNRELKGDN